MLARFAGFYAARSNPRTIEVWDMTFRACAATPLYDDQTMFWLILRNIQQPVAYPLAQCPRLDDPPPVLPHSDADASTDTAVLSTAPATPSSYVVNCPLDSCLYSASQLSSYEGVIRLQQAMQSAGTKAIMVRSSLVPSAAVSLVGSY